MNNRNFIPTGSFSARIATKKQQEQAAATKKQQEQAAAKTALLILRVMQWTVESGLKRDARGWWFTTDTSTTYTDADIYMKFFTDTKNKTNVKQRLTLY